MANAGSVEIVDRRYLVVACLGWAVVGAGIALSGMGEVNQDALAVVWSAMVVGVVSALVAGWFAYRDQPRWAGVALVVSVVIPTWFAVWLNLVPLVGGVLLIARSSGRSGSRAEPAGSLGRAGR
ncbi:MAG: hypothetical protein KDB09_06730 [Acidimicrobiales bacterium]|nr:hypothetical protein [Acidimicrobiales bacterium]